MSTPGVQHSTLNIQHSASLNIGRWTLLVTGFSRRLTFAALFARVATACLGQDSPPSTEQPRDLTVLILGDSLGLCGFSKRLDQKFRADPRIRSVFTYCTCGTNPLSWLKEKPFTHIQTHCGYWSIESKPDSHGIKEQRD